MRCVAVPVPKAGISGKGTFLFRDGEWVLQREPTERFSRAGASRLNPLVAVYLKVL